MKGLGIITHERRLEEQEKKILMGTKSLILDTGGIPVKEELDLSGITSENRAGTNERKLCGGRFLAQYCEEQPLAPGMGCLVR